jgi:hypothetical protein
MLLTYYLSGIEVRPGDHIIYHGEEGRVEFVAVMEDLETRWYVRQYGIGCMLAVPSFGSVYITQPCNDEDLEFVARDSGQ